MTNHKTLTTLTAEELFYYWRGRGYQLDPQAGRLIYPFDQMEPGDCFAIPLQPGALADQRQGGGVTDSGSVKHTVRTATYRHGNRRGRRYMTNEDGAWLYVWRIDGIEPMSDSVFREIQAVMGMTNLEMASKLGVSNSLVEKMRTGEATVRPHIVAKIDQLYGDYKAYGGAKIASG